MTVPPPFQSPGRPRARWLAQFFSLGGERNRQNQKRTKMRFIMTSLVATAATFGAAAHAQTLLNVKVGVTANAGTGDGAYMERAAAVLGSTNSWWNEYAYVVSTPTGVSVVDSSGVTIPGLALTVQNSNPNGSHLGTYGNPSFLMNDMPRSSPGGVFTISLTGLAANTEYEFIGYAADNALGLGANWAVTTGTLISGTTSNDGTTADITGGAGTAYSDFFVMADDSGNLTITDASLTSSYSVLSGFQLEVATVPEPSTMATIISGFGMFCICRTFGRAKIKGK